MHVDSTSGMPSPSPNLQMRACVSLCIPWSLVLITSKQCCSCLTTLQMCVCTCLWFDQTGRHTYVRTVLWYENIKVKTWCSQSCAACFPLMVPFCCSKIVQIKGQTWAAGMLAGVAVACCSPQVQFKGTQTVIEWQVKRYAYFNTWAQKWSAFLMRPRLCLRSSFCTQSFKNCVMSMADE